MQLMLWANNAFDQSLGNWDLSSLTNAIKMLEISSLSRAHYEATLIGWTNNTNTPGNVSLGASGHHYAPAAAVATHIDQQRLDYTGRHVPSLEDSNHKPWYYIKVFLTLDCKKSLILNLIG